MKIRSQASFKAHSISCSICVGDEKKYQASTFYVRKQIRNKPKKKMAPSEANGVRVWGLS
jgi:hypothetical protein